MTINRTGRNLYDIAEYSDMKGALKRQYGDALVASGLVDDVQDILLLDPLLQRFSEGEYLCHRGDKADHLWVLVCGSIAVRDGDRTVYVRNHPDIVGEINILNGENERQYDLVANESLVEVLAVRRSAIEKHPHADRLWRNIAGIVARKLKLATAQTVELLEQIRDDTTILQAYTNSYALGRRLGAGGSGLTRPRVENAIVWFSDIVNFTRSVMTLPPAQTADLVQRFFNLQAEIIETRGGHVDKFMGDGLMAFWILSNGSGEGCAEICASTLDAAEEAVRAVSRIKVGNESLGLRVGLHIGNALSGDFGSAKRHQFTLIGAAVNMAAQLEQIHDEDIVDGGPCPGPVRISEEFRKALPDAIRRRYEQSCTADTRKMGRVTLYTSPQLHDDEAEVTTP